MPLDVVIAPAARRDIKKLGKKAQQKIISGIEKLIENPRPPGVEKIRQAPSCLRFRIGDYRIVYSIFQQRKIIILLIRDRKEVYRALDSVNQQLAKVITEIEQEEQKRQIYARH